MVRWGQVIRTIVGVVLIPLCVAAAITFGRVALAAEAKGYHVLLALVLGAVTYVLLIIFFYRSIVKTLFSKEPVTMMWSTVTGYKLASEPQEGRSSEPPTDTKGRRVPLWAVMVPYLVPIYTVAGVLIVWVVKLVLGGRFPNSTYEVVQAFVMGLTYAFHVFLVSHDIREKNPHLRAAGYLFTLVLLFLVNIEILAGLGMLVFKNVSWLRFNELLYSQAKYIYAWFLHFNYNPFRWLG